MDKPRHDIHELTYILRVNFLLTKCHTVAVLLSGLGNPFGVIPWLVHGIQKTTKNTNNISIFNWIPRSSRVDDNGKTIYVATPSRNDDLQAYRLYTHIAQFTSFYSFRQIVVPSGLSSRIICCSNRRLRI